MAEKKIRFEYEEVDGKKVRIRPTEADAEVDGDGFWRRQGNHYTRPFEGVPGFVGKIAGSDVYGIKTTGKEPTLKAEPYRYRLVWAKLCHWSNRVSIVRELEGLEDVISVNLADHGVETRKFGWEFMLNEDNTDPILGDRFLSEAYYRADDEYAGRTTVPALIDTVDGKVVNNDTQWLTNYLEVSFRPFHKKGAPDLYPEELRPEIDKWNEWLFDNINNSVYRCWFSKSKEGYNDGYRTFYAAMDLLEKKLETQRFLLGDYVTDADIRLFVTLSRLDIRYTWQLGETKHRLVDYPNLWGYARDLWQIPAFRNNTYFVDFANPYLASKGAYKASYNYRFLQQIDFEGLWGAPTDRARLSKDPIHKFREEQDGGTLRTANGFKGYKLSPEKKEELERDAAIYKQVHGDDPAVTRYADIPAVKDSKDIPVFIDKREDQAKEIRKYIKKHPDKADLLLTKPLNSSAKKKEIRDEQEALRTYIKNNITDTVTTLLTTVHLREFDEAFTAFYAALDHLDELLGTRRFLLGDYISEADIDLFVTLVRFDAGYSRFLGATRNRIRDYKNIWGYARDLYAVPAFYRSTDWKEIITLRNEEGIHLPTSTFYDVVLPATDLDEVWKDETERAYLSSDPTHVFLLTEEKRFYR